MPEDFIINKHMFVFVNKRLIWLFGIECASYISELLDLCSEGKKDILIDREKMSHDTGISTDKQYFFDRILQQYNLIKISNDNLNILQVNTSNINNLIVNYSTFSHEYVTNIKKSVDVNYGQRVKMLSIAKHMKASINIDDVEIKECFYSWVDSCIGNVALSTDIVTSFYKGIMDYTNNKNIIKELVIFSAKRNINSPQYAISCYEKEHSDKTRIPRVTSQRRTEISNINLDKSF